MRILGFRGNGRFLTVVWNLDLDLDMFSGLWHINVSNFVSLSWFWRCKDYPCLLSPYLGLWRMLEALEWDLASLSWFGYCHWSLVHPYSEFWLSIFILKVQRKSMSFQSSFGALEIAGGSWLKFSISIFIWIWPLVFYTRGHIQQSSPKFPKCIIVFRINTTSDLSLRIW